jgi:hypothetical protein
LSEERKEKKKKGRREDEIFFVLADLDLSTSFSQLLRALSHPPPLSLLPLCRNRHGEIKTLLLLLFVRNQVEANASEERSGTKSLSTSLSRSRARATRKEKTPISIKNPLSFNACCQT